VVREHGALQRREGGEAHRRAAVVRSGPRIEMRGRGRSGSPLSRRRRPGARSRRSTRTGAPPLPSRCLTIHWDERSFPHCAKRTSCGRPGVRVSHRIARYDRES
jgi:hypothetical protein